MNTNYFLANGLWTKFFNFINYKSVLLIGIVLFNHTISNGQSCQCHFDFPVGQQLWSNSGSGGSGYVVDKLICVHGTLVIDINVKFLNCYFHMYPGSSIVISNNKLFESTGCKYQRCDGAMWNGIQVTYGAEVNFYQNTIEDALIGIEFLPFSTTNIFTENKFNRCSYGIQANGAITKRPFLRNKFYSNGTLFSPHIGELPAFGMNLHNMTITERFGDYDQMHKGIGMNNTIYIGDHIKMNHGRTTVPIPTQNPSMCINATNLSNLTLNNSTFRLYPFGIVTGESDVTITDNFFNNMAAGIIITQCEGRTISVLRNNLDTMFVGGIRVQRANATLSAMIKTNNINFRGNSIFENPQLPSLNCTGIEFANDFPISEVEAEISSNHVFQNNANSANFYGYDLFYTGNLTCQSNTVNFEFPSNTINYIGLKSTECDKMTLMGNTISGGGTNTPLSLGINVWNTTNSLLCCNSTEKVNIGTEFFLANNATKYRGSVNTGPYTGYTLNFESAMTGIIQEYPGNSWTGVAPNDARFGGGDIQEAIDNFFKISSMGLPFFPDNPIVGPSLWFRPITLVPPQGEYLCSEDPDCNGLAGINCNDYPNDQLLLIDGYSGIHGEGLTWQARKHVIKDYWKDASFGCNDSMSITFKSVHQNSNLGKLAQISNVINSIFQLPLNIKQSLSNLSNAINDEILAIKNIDAMWEVEGSDLDYWTTQREIHRLLLVQAWSDYSAILTTHHVNIIAAVPPIQASLSAISPTNVMETNDVYVTSLSLSRLVDPNMTLSAVQLTMLENIANQCPLDGGDAVSRARAILHNIDSDYFNAGVNCSGIPGLRSKSNHQIINKIQIVPNPNNGNFKFQMDHQTKNQKFNLAIYNVNGIHINTIHSLGLSSIINLDLNSGLYIIKITHEDGTTTCQKLIINK